jgi:hypothetical protein
MVHRILRPVLMTTKFIFDKNGTEDFPNSSH